MIVIGLVIILLFVFYKYNTRTFNYWKDRGVKHDQPTVLVGNSGSNYMYQKSFTEMITDFYWKYPEEKIVGFFRSTKPELIIRDPEIIQRVLVKDFSSFYPRGLNTHKDVIEPMLRNLFFADGDMWRLLRQRMTPAFTSGKLRAMFPLIVERAEKLLSRLAMAAEKGCAVDAREVMARYTTDFIGACGFGLDSDSLNEEDSAFRKLGAKIFSVNFMQFVLIALKDAFPDLLKHYKQLGNVEDELTQLVTAIMKQRNYQPSGRHDFIDLLLECRQKGALTGESIERRKADGTPDITTVEFDDILLTAQVFVFFAAGFETSSSATSFTLHQLAYNQDIQRKVQEDIDKALAKHDNKLSYESIKDMTYLHWTFKEGMRMFPSLGFLARKCVHKYTIPEVGVTIDDKVQIIIPVQGLHMDPKYFDNPEEFRPERFDPEVFDMMKLKHVYLPFGEGPRACIGERLGEMQSLAGLAAVLSQFSVTPAPTTRRRPRVDPVSGIVQSIKGGLPLLFKART